MHTLAKPCWTASAHSLSMSAARRVRLEERVVDVPRKVRGDVAGLARIGDARGAAGDDLGDLGRAAGRAAADAGRAVEAVGARTGPCGSGEAGHHLAGDRLDELGAVVGRGGHRGSSALGLRYCCSMAVIFATRGAVPFRAPRGGEEGVDDLEGQPLADHPGAEGQHVGVVVLARVAGHRGVVGVRRAHAGDLVGGHRGADAGAVDDDAARAGAGRDQAGDDVGEVRVVHGVGAVRAAVRDAEALVGEVLRDDGLEGEAAVVRADGDGPSVAGDGAVGRAAGRGRGRGAVRLPASTASSARSTSWRITISSGRRPLSHGPAPIRPSCRRRRGR